MFLENATNAVFGGLGEDEGNTIIGGGDVANGVLRDGIIATGTLTGSSITGTDMTETSTGVWLRDAQGIDVNNTLITASESFGLYANGTLTGSSFHDNLITGTTGVNGANGNAMSLAGAQNLAIYDNIGEDSFGAGIYVSGDTTGTTVKSNLFDGNRSGITLVNATNAVIGGLGEDEGNVVVGDSDLGNGFLSDGIQVVGTSTGSRVLGTISSNTSSGVYLGNATGVEISGGSTDTSEAFGVYATGVLTGSSLTDLTISGSGGLGFYGDGVHLASASGLTVTGNMIEDNLGSGLAVTGDTTGTVVRDNDFDGNRVAIYLLNATNAVIGGDLPGEDNRIVGGGDASTNDFRDGIVVTGTSTGSSITQTTINDTSIGVWLNAATGVTIDTAIVKASQVFGLVGTGVLTGTQVLTSTFSGTTTGAGGGSGVLLQAAQSLLIQDATISDNAIGLTATGDCGGSEVLDTTWSGNTTGVIDTSTGVPPLDIDPLP
jgi:parallel beta-helix repeat protein